MKELVPIDLKALADSLKAEGKRRKVVWQDSESIAFLTCGRKERKDFHVDPSDEVTLQLSGEQNLVYITPEGDHHVAVIRPGEALLCPGGVPHSPRVLEDGWFVVFERVRKPGEKDRFQWFCDQCGAKVYEVAVEVRDYHQDPVSQVHQRFYSDASLRTCKGCGSVISVPEP